MVNSFEKSRFLLVKKLLEGEPLTPGEAAQLAQAMLDPSFDNSLKAAALAALRVRGEQPGEVVGFARALRDRAVRVEYGGEVLLDTAGTGGDGLSTLNASTAAALVAASLGVPTAKHGNRSFSSKSGSADVMEMLGYNINHRADRAVRMLSTLGFTFLYAPNYHPAMKAVVPVRRKLATRTIFNLVGPLANPAFNNVQVIGVARRSLMPVIASAASLLGYDAVLVVHGDPGMDEVSVTGETKILEVRRGRIEEYSITPEDLGLPITGLKELRVANAVESAERVRRALSGRGRRSDEAFIAANAAAALYVAGFEKDLKGAAEAAVQAIREGRPAALLEKAVKASLGM
ncbi:anthranilate phosphoribosyltransferase [Aeropyrum pernix K1]|uniref:Anthranilate phosphoribosyltransferase n=1 Tax=Aeropyrum pernix (strain ATCC 700893 / DSM 11879 / JCM 9820 / NBRC 100138 / K1) TaxID=272557 RepID=TRPD_AERPE|nr:anthranilate phosphoribosyltransferase [Aeropyrum pernix]Q9Y8T2.1 RecName: Full=Anthranilate phosphoribosyltransferase [Aeropyrum pernix K1]BAA81568.1 anthranilate phosphoribosyltransferase [Aeropyrum pernix K1]